MPNTVPQYLPDTNIIVHFVRQSSLYQWIAAHYPLAPSDPAPHLSIVNVGEIRSLAKQFVWGDIRLQRVRDFIARSVISPLDEAIIEAYVEIDNYSLKIGRKMGENDLWIAATASVTQATLLTTDKDFDHLHTVYLQREWIDPATP